MADFVLRPCQYQILVWHWLLHISGTTGGSGEHTSTKVSLDGGHNGLQYKPIFHWNWTRMVGPNMIRPVESHSGARENIITGPYHPPPPILHVLRSRHRRRREGGNVGRLGEVSPHHQTRVRGSAVSSHNGLRGRAPAENGFYAYFRSERNNLEHHFQYFWATAGPPNVAGPGKTFPPLPPSRRDWIWLRHPTNEWIQQYANLPDSY